MDAFWTKGNPCVKNAGFFFANEKKTGGSFLGCVKNKQSYTSMNMSSKSDPPEHANIN